ncbi:MAG TPA: adenine phosphoribosyltransferase [Candidatus Merdibacter merdavium]|uniref:Adenine phosphoribosyltransferase n=1 Tax=Candidatus Merdibacter merdavium TaxID=2838692 RepID=A0A9D2NS07_9FIRM|nr:adenine phosphoribosyltransferase [Candidatus Merdibacter merdavium]
MDLREYIASIEGFPKEGIIFRDVTPLLADGDAFHDACERLIAFARKLDADVIVGPESRGFMFGCPVSYALGIGFVPVRKPNKLPRQTLSCSYDLEYGSNTLEMHVDGIRPGQRVVIIDDLLATGGTVEATVKMIRELGGEPVGCAFIIELSDLHGRDALADMEVLSLLTYEGE